MNNYMNLLTDKVIVKGVYTITINDVDVTVDEDGMTVMIDYTVSNTQEGVAEEGYNSLNSFNEMVKNLF